MFLAKYDPFREVRSLQDEVNRLFSNAYPANGREDMLNGNWFPKVDIFENTESLVLEAELPGMTRDEVIKALDGHAKAATGIIGTFSKP